MAGTAGRGYRSAAARICSRQTRGLARSDYGFRPTQCKTRYQNQWLKVLYPLVILNYSERPLPSALPMNRAKSPSPTASMTAFARREAATPWGALTWELRSVNHRYLEIALRLPEELRVLEPRVRELINARVARGKVDGTLRFQAGEAAAGTIELNEDQVQRLLVSAGPPRGLYADLSPLRAIDILRSPGVLNARPL